ncbi:ribonuclease H-like domain-containing protein [candidate division KSB1 bacterium]|nr:ribonuclease H-like domain-containing protein [candidate division KSB1 bacterium]
MANLKEKLASLYPVKNTHIDRRTAVDVQVLSDLNASIAENDRGACIKRTRIFSEKPLPGLAIAAFGDLSGEDFCRLGKDFRFNRISPEGVAIIDTETTGLAGGTGTLPFMVGVARFSTGQLIVNQYFMRDYSDEPAVLRFIETELQTADALISYNGRSYDWPLLRNRFILNRFAVPAILPHLDLLHTVRRLYRTRLGRCDLQSCERSVLGFSRIGDLPGSAIPQVYFDYLATGDLRPVRPVFRHNALDLVTLCAIASQSAPLFRPDTWKKELFCDIEGVIKTLQSLSLHAEVEAVFQNHLETRRIENETHLYYRYAETLKRQGRVGAAAEIWRKLDELASGWSPLAAIELAKYCEHHLRDPQTALERVVRAQTRLDFRQQMGSADRFDDACRDLAHRHRRLTTKIGKRKNDHDHAPLSC